MNELKKRCKFCDKEIVSLYLEQLNQNLKVHEDACKNNPKNKK